MKSSAEKAIFWTLYIFIAAFSLSGTLLRDPENAHIMLIVFIGSLIVWYFILKFIFWVIRRLCPVFIELLKAIARIPETLWKFTLDRVREFGKALRNED